MWGKNTDDKLYHYFESLADGRYKCGKSQRVKNMLVFDLPNNRCPECNRYYMSLPEKSRVSPPTIASTAPDLALAQSSLSTPHEQNEAPVAEVTTTIYNPIGNTKYKYSLTKDFEEAYLRHVLDIITQHKNTKSETLRRVRSIQRIGREDYTDSVITTWKITNNEQALQALTSIQDSPYFGRMDFLEGCYVESEDEDQTPDIMYIGRATVQNATGEFLVYDWRAPISQMYYQYNPGPASYRAPASVISGEMVRKRTYEIRNGEIVAIYDAANKQYDSEDTMDEMLRALLDRNSTDKMRQIVQSIQAEQDSVIRSVSDILVVQGPAGSGKTVIALHRAAYLLYQIRLNRERLNERYSYISAQRMLVFSPNSIFADYISRVLPDLHEGRIRQVILEHFLQDELRNTLRKKQYRATYTIESNQDCYEYALDKDIPDYNSRAYATLIKTSAVMLTAIDIFLQRYEHEVANQFKDVYRDPSHGD